MYIKQPFPKDIIKTINEFGAAIVPNLFDVNTVQALEAEIDNTFSSLQPKDEACFTNCGMSVTSDSYKAGKVMRIDRASYSMFPEINKNLVTNTVLQEVVELYYGELNNSFMQTFCTHEFISRNEEWVDGINQNAGLHFDPYHALKFIIFITDTTKENGATRLILKSNTEGKEFRENLRPTYYKGKSVLDCHTPFINSKFDESDAVYAEAPAGSLLIFDTDLWHGGGEILNDGLERKYIICHNRRM